MIVYCGIKLFAIISVDHLWSDCGSVLQIISQSRDNSIGAIVPAPLQRSPNHPRGIRALFIRGLVRAPWDEPSFSSRFHCGISIKRQDNASVRGKESETSAMQIDSSFSANVPSSMASITHVASKRHDRHCVTVTALRAFN